MSHHPASLIYDEDCLHVPVLLQETLTALAVRPNAIYIDATLGAGGHAEAILEATAPHGRLLGIDADPDALRMAQCRLSRFGQRVVITHGNFAHLGRLAAAHGFNQVDGVLFDLGVSSMELGPKGRGFSFQYDAPLDMRYDPSQGETAADLVNTLPEKALADLIFRLGEEPRSRLIARAIVANRPIATTGQLAAVVQKAVGRGGRIHPATRTFLALRLAVNRELEVLAEALPQAVELLRPGGRVVVIAFHSLEDRLVKRFLQQEARDCLCPPDQLSCTCGHRARLRVITRKVITPGLDEQERNPRSRSARLRAAERLAPRDNTGPMTSEGE